MSPKSFAILALATAASVGLAVSAIAGRDPPTRTTAASEPMFPGLLDRANDIRKVEIVTPAGHLTATAMKQGWALTEKAGFPVEPEQVRKLVLAVANLQLVEAKTADPERLKRLELEEPGADGAKSRRVVLAGSDGAPIATVIVGKASPGLYGSGRGGVYVRRAGEDQAWLAAGELDLPADALALIGRDVIDLPADRIARVTAQAGAAASVSLSRPNAETVDFTTDAALPDGRALDAAKVELLTGSLANLSMEDVRPATEVAMPPDATRTSFETFDGLTVDVAVGKVGEGQAVEHWATLAVTAPSGDLAPDAAKTQAPPASAADLAARLHGWAFKLPPYLAERLEGGLDQLLSEPEPAS